MAPHPLDNPVWNALCGRQAQLAKGGALARRFDETIGPFAASRDDSAEAVAALAALAHENDDMSLLQRAPPAPPPGVTLKVSAPGVQMIAHALAKSAAAPPPIEPLGAADIDAMAALATLTRPGPFRARTHTLGRFVGVKANGVLVAMAGERLKPEGHVEVSGVCTHPEHRGKGYAAALSRAVAQRILDEGETPFLHAYASNAAAIALYRDLGFAQRCEVTHAIWSA